MGVLGKKKDVGAGTAVQLREGGRHPFGVLDGYVPLGHGEIALYRSIREAVPIVDAALRKLVRLAGGVQVLCRDRDAQEGLDWFLQHVNTGRGQRGIQSFLDCYLDSMLTCGRAVGEIVPDRRGRDIAALLCGNPADIEIREGDSPLEFAIWGRDAAGGLRELPRQELLLFTPFQPEVGSPYGVSLLRSMPFLTEILLKIYQAVGMNWERMGNVRFAVVYKPGDSPLDQSMAQERSRQIAREWSAAMQAGKDGSVRDFVAVGDVDIKVIGADNQIWTARCRCGRSWSSWWPGRDPALPAGAVLVLHRADEHPAGRHDDQRDHRHPAGAGAGGGAHLRAVADPPRL